MTKIELVKNETGGEQTNDKKKLEEEEELSIHGSWRCRTILICREFPTH